MAASERELQALNLKLDHIEEELRSKGRWQEQRIDPLATLPPGRAFAHPDSSSFTDWLQFEFLPAARGALAEGGVPTRSILGLIALGQHGDPSGDPELRNLLRLFDELSRDLGAGDGS